MDDVPQGVNRRGMLAGTAATVMLANAASVGAQAKAPFLWGVAASAAQTESRQGRGRSNWDVFADTPGKIADGSTNARCTEFDQRYLQDLDLLKAAGVKAFRFSTSWPRIQPEGPGKPSQAGLDLYSRMIDAMLARGIEPWVTLFHWDVPVWAGDFRQRDIAARMADYGGYVVSRLGDRVKHWIALNEPNSVAVAGYLTGIHAPGLAELPAALAAIHHQNLSIGMVTQAVRAHAIVGSVVGTTHAVAPVRPSTPTDADRAAAAKLDMIWNGAFTDPLFGRGYPAMLAPLIAPLVKEGDLAIIAAKPDFLGLNYYQRIYIKADDSAAGLTTAEAPSALQRTASFVVEPDGMTEALISVRDRYGDVPIYVTETGFALENEPNWAAQIKDGRRQAYLDSYLAAVAAAKAKGVDVRGLFYWSATDNWEWADGFKKRFGLIAVDPVTQRRGAKQTLSRYGNLIRKHF